MNKKQYTQFAVGIVHAISMVVVAICWRCCPLLSSSSSPLPPLCIYLLFFCCWFLFIRFMILNKCLNNIPHKIYVGIGVSECIQVIKSVLRHATFKNSNCPCLCANKRIFYSNEQKQQHFIIVRDTNHDSVYNTYITKSFFIRVHFH